MWGRITFWGLCVLFASNAHALNLIELATILQGQNSSLQLPAILDSEEAIAEHGELALKLLRTKGQAILEQDPREMSFRTVLLGLEDYWHLYQEISVPLTLAQINYCSDPRGTLATGFLNQLATLCDEFLKTKTLRQVVETLKGLPLGDEQKRLVEVWEHAFENKANTVKALADEAEIRGLYRDLIQAESDYEASLRDDARTLFLTEKEVRGVPPTLLVQLPKKQRGYEITTSLWPHYDAIVGHAHDRKAREKVYRAYWQSGSDTSLQNVKLMLELRRRIGSRAFENSWFGHRVKGSSAEPAQRLQRQLRSLSKRTQDLFDEETEKGLTILWEKDPEVKSIELWDVAYLRNTLAATSQGDADTVQSYLSLPSVLEGLVKYSQHLFGLRIEKLEGWGAWHPDVLSYAVFDEGSGILLGVISLDLLEREKKNAWYFCQNITYRRNNGKRVELPLAGIFCVFSKGTENRPPLLTPEEVTTLFHEFGHALHHVLAKNSYFSLNELGYNEDLSEVPSNFLELLALQPEILQSYAKHWSTQEPIPAKLAQGIHQASLAFSTYTLRDRTVRSLLDSTLHQHRARDPMKTARALYEQLYLPLPARADFPRLFEYFTGGYDGLFWSYLWGRSVASHLIEQMKASEGGLLDNTLGLHFRRQFLGPSALYESPKILEDTLQTHGSKFDFCGALIASYAYERGPSKPQPEETH